MILDLFKERVMSTDKKDTIDRISGMNNLGNQSNLGIDDQDQPGTNVSQNIVDSDYFFVEKLDELKNENRKLSKELSRVCEELLSANLERALKETQLGLLNKRVDERDSIILATKDELKVAMDKHRVLENELTELKQHIENLEEELRKTDKKLRKSAVDLRETAEKLKATDERLRETDGKLRKTEEELQKHQNINHKQSKWFKTLEIKNAELVQKLDDSQKELIIKQQTVQSLKGEVKAVKEETEKEKADQGIRVNQLEAQLHQLRLQLETETKAKNEALAKIKTYEQASSEVELKASQDAKQKPSTIPNIIFSLAINQRESKVEENKVIVEQKVEHEAANLNGVREESKVNEQQPIQQVRQLGEFMPQALQPDNEQPPVEIRVAEQQAEPEEQVLVPPRQNEVPAEQIQMPIQAQQIDMPAVQIPEPVQIQVQIQAQQTPVAVPQDSAQEMLKQESELRGLLIIEAKKLFEEEWNKLEKHKKTPKYLETGSRQEKKLNDEISEVLNTNRDVLRFFESKVSKLPSYLNLHSFYSKKMGDTRGFKITEIVRSLEIVPWILSLEKRDRENKVISMFFDYMQNPRGSHLLSRKYLSVNLGVSDNKGLYWTHNASTTEQREQVRKILQEVEKCYKNLCLEPVYAERRSLDPLPRFNARRSCSPQTDAVFKALLAKVPGFQELSRAIPSKLESEFLVCKLIPVWKRDLRMKDQKDVIETDSKKLLRTYMN